jgi:hypothetical protein
LRAAKIELTVGFAVALARAGASVRLRLGEDHLQEGHGGCDFFAVGEVDFQFHDLTFRGCVVVEIRLFFVLSVLSSDTKLNL